MKPAPTGCRPFGEPAGPKHLLVGAGFKPARIALQHLSFSSLHLSPLPLGEGKGEGKGLGNNNNFLLQKFPSPGGVPARLWSRARVGQITCPHVFDSHFGKVYIACKKLPCSQRDILMFQLPEDIKCKSVYAAPHDAEPH